MYIQSDIEQTAPKAPCPIDNFKRLSFRPSCTTQASLLFSFQIFWSWFRQNSFNNPLCPRIKVIDKDVLAWQATAKRKEQKQSKHPEAIFLLYLHISPSAYLVFLFYVYLTDAHTRKMSAPISLRNATWLYPFYVSYHPAS